MCAPLHSYSSSGLLMGTPAIHATPVTAYGRIRPGHDEPGVLVLPFPDYVAARAAVSGDQGRHDARRGSAVLRHERTARPTRGTHRGLVPRTPLPASGRASAGGPSRGHSSCQAWMTHNGLP